MSTYGMVATGNPRHRVVHTVEDGPRCLGRTVWVRWACGRSCSSAVVYPPGVVPPGKGCPRCAAALRVSGRRP